MNCEEVNNHLSEYLDKTLDTATTTRVATHIIACSLCHAQSNELADCIHEVAALPMIDPPLGFAQRVMAHVQEIESNEKSIWQRLFAPFTKAIPIQATALILISVLAVFLYQKEDPLKKDHALRLALRSESPSTTSEQNIAATRQAPSAPPRALQAEKKAKLDIKQPFESTKSTAPTSPSLNQQLASTPASKAEPKAEIAARFEDQKDAPRKAPIRVQEVTTARDARRLSSDALGFGAGPVGGIRQYTPRPAPLLLESSMAALTDRSADMEFVVRRFPPQRRDQAEDANIESLRKSTQADAVSSVAPRFASPPAAAATPKIESIAEIRFYNVAPEHMEIFKKELALESIVEAESKLSAKEKEALAQSDRPLLIKVTILPPETSAAPH